MLQFFVRVHDVLSEGDVHLYVGWLCVWPQGVKDYSSGVINCWYERCFEFWFRLAGDVFWCTFAIGVNCCALPCMISKYRD